MGYAVGAGSERGLRLACGSATLRAGEYILNQGRPQLMTLKFNAAGGCMVRFPSRVWLREGSAYDLALDRKLETHTSRASSISTRRPRPAATWR